MVTVDTWHRCSNYVGLHNPLNTSVEIEIIDKSQVEYNPKTTEQYCTNKFRSTEIQTKHGFPMRMSKGEWFILNNLCAIWYLFSIACNWLEKRNL